MPLRRPEAGSFEHLLVEHVVAVDSLVRLSRFPTTEPFWSRGRYRFDGPSSPDGFGTCYAAWDIAVAFSETVVHECGWFRDGHYQVPLADLTSRHVVTLRRPAQPSLRLADLTGKPLKAIGLNNDLSAGDDYAGPMAWAAAIHAADARWDGIRYISRQHNDRAAVALFERSGVLRGRSRRLSGQALDALCDEFGIVAV